MQLRQQGWVKEPGVKNFWSWRCLRGMGGVVALSGVLVTLPFARGQAQTTYTIFPVMQQNSETAGTQPVKHGAAARVTLILHDSTIKYAVSVLARQAHLQPVYDDSPELSKRISVRLVDVNVMDAYAAVLRGTNLRAKVASNGEIVMIHRETEGSSGRESQNAVGLVAGRVTDSASSAGVGGATVKVQGTKLSAVTSDSGDFVLRNVPVGEQLLVVQLFGYKPVRRSVTVHENERTLVHVVMSPVATVLSGVVTTATGVQRKIEVGNDITTINVDSVMQVAPITSVTDLLETRVPGLTVLHSSGTPGDPSRIRLRGASSITGNNDPIVIVDGVRVYASQSDERNNNLAPSSTKSLLGADVVSSYAAPSPLDQIDPNTIESIEVFKGPSATSLYGSDAANGVIVITTKHGRAGKTHWDLSLNQGVNWLPGKWPVNYYRFGSSLVPAGLTGPYEPSGTCYWFDATCTVDSVVAFQALNDPKYTVFSHGVSQNASITVSGGVPTLLYSFTGSAQRTTGNLRLPDIEQQRYEKFYGPIPNYLVNPDRYTTEGGSGQITAQPSATFSLTWTSLLFRSDQQRSSLQSAIPQLQGTYIDPTQLASAGLIRNEYERATDQQLSTTNSVDLMWHTLPWLQLKTTGGINAISRTDETLIPYGINSASPGSLTGDTTGSYGLGKGASQVLTLNIGATLPLRWVRMAIGLNYINSSTSDVSAQTSQLSPGLTHPQTFPQDSSTFSESSTASATYGWYVQPTLAVNTRFFVSPGFRLDGGSASGAHAGLTGFPKIDFSYVAIDADHPLGIVTLFRPRLAFGYAGTQPNPASKLRLFASDSGLTVRLTNLGNTQLRPERTSEIEGGFDTDFGNDRLQVTLTMYNKTRHDAIVSFLVPPSVSGESSAQISRNIGVVRNTGTEMDFSARLIDRAGLSWVASANVSHGNSRVLKLNPGVSDVLSTSTLNHRVAVGYPLDGVWARPIVSYVDANHDGIIERSEIRLGDSVAFIGQTEPKYQMNVSSTLGMLNGHLSVTANVAYVNGITQSRGFGGASNGVLLNVPNAPNASFATQAAIAASIFGETGNIISYGSGSDIGVMQTVNVLRFNSLSINYFLPSSVLQFMRVPSMSIALQGKNLGIHTNYRGADPNVNAFSTSNSGGLIDTGQLPQPRTWSLTFRVGN